MRIGMNGLTGPVLVTPTRLFSHPHWNTAVMTPNAAAAESRFMIAAVAGMARLRKTTMSKMNDRATTMPTKSGSLEDSWSATSMPRAVWPPTST